MSNENGQRWHCYFAGAIAEQSDGEYVAAIGVTTESESRFQATGDRGDLIAWVPVDRQHDRNARLIAAAPELLAAVEAAVQRSIERKKMGGRGGVLDDDILQILTALIARCGGQSK